MEKGIAWFWSIRRREAPDRLMGIICLYDVEDNNRGFWLAPEFQGKGFMREASIAATDYWFNTLNKPVLRAPKAAANSRSRRISDAVNQNGKESLRQRNAGFRVMGDHP